MGTGPEPARRSGRGDSLHPTTRPDSSQFLAAKCDEHRSHAADDRPPPNPARGGLLRLGAENGGLPALAFLRLPSATHFGIASRSAPARRHSPAAWRASGSSSSPSDVPRKIPAASASRSARPPATRRNSATAAASSSPVSGRHFALCLASPMSDATIRRSRSNSSTINIVTSHTQTINRHCRVI
jgi:hypothetical protein